MILKLFVPAIFCITIVSCSPANINNTANITDTTFTFGKSARPKADSGMQTIDLYAALDSSEKANYIAVDTTYMWTGLYLLTDSTEGVKMRREYSKEIYYISKKPFASVDHIIKSSVDYNEVENYEYRSLRLKFDNATAGIIDDVTTSNKGGSIAVIIGGKLWLVPVIQDRITTGDVSISVDMFSKKDIEEMLRVIESKE